MAWIGRWLGRHVSRGDVILYGLVELSQLEIGNGSLNIDIFVSGIFFERLCEGCDGLCIFHGQVADDAELVKSIRCEVFGVSLFFRFLDQELNGVDGVLVISLVDLKKAIFVARSQVVMI